MWYIGLISATKWQLSVGHNDGSTHLVKLDLKFKASLKPHLKPPENSFQLFTYIVASKVTVLQLYIDLSHVRSSI